MTRLFCLFLFLVLLLCGAQLRTPRIERGIAQPISGAVREWRGRVVGRRWGVEVRIVRVI
jgi:hypothetical protein